MADGILIARAGATDLVLLPQMANRHGLVAGATGTGKTVTLQSLAEGLSRAGVPVFAADIKGDLSGTSQPGGGNAKVDERVAALGLDTWDTTPPPVELWDVFGEQGHPIRATVSEVGPLLLARMLELNDVQEGVLNVAFRVADDAGLLLLDLKDLRSLLAYVAENSSTIAVQYGNVADASVASIQRALLTLEDQGGDKLFGEPALDLTDLMRTSVDGRGVVNLLAADRLMQAPKVYATFLLWLLSELFEELPEVGDLPRPKLVVFFDEAHLLFDDAPPALLARIEQVVRLIRSKGVGVFFVTQNPADIPDDVLGQLGNKVQHALRAFTPKDQQAVKAVADNFRPNPALDVAQAVTELAIGEALVSLLDEGATPTVVERALVVPPHGHIGAITAEQRAAARAASLVGAKYVQAVDRVSAYETLQQRAEAKATAAQAEAAQAQLAQQAAAAQAAQPAAPAQQAAPQQAGGSILDNPVATAAAAALGAAGMSMVRSMGSAAGRQLMRGILGGLTGSRKR